MRVLGDKLLVEQDPPTNMIGRFFVPQGKEEYPSLGTVRAVGPRVREPDLVVGARVLFKRKPSSAINPDASKPGDEHWGMLILPEEYIIGIVTEEGS